MSTELISNNDPIFEKYRIEKTYEYFEKDKKGKIHRITDQERINKLTSNELTNGTYILKQLMPNGKSNVVKDQKTINAIFHDQNIKSRQFRVFKLGEDGKEFLLKDREHIERVFDGNYMSGSIAFTRDTRHRGILHKLIYIFQCIHAFILRRKKNSDLHAAHGLLITGKGKVSKETPHPYLIAHTAYQGIQYANRDFLFENDTTDFLIYRPKEDNYRETIKHYVESTAFNNKEELRTARSPRKRNLFSYKDLVFSIFHNCKHHACEKKGRTVSSRIMKGTASLIADLIYDNQLSKDDGITPRKLFCTPYAMSIAQGSLIMKEVQDVSKDQKYGFRIVNGKPLSRKDLANKIFLLLKSKDIKNEKNEYAKRLYSAYHGNKLARIDTRYMMSSYSTKLLDKMCTTNK